MCNGKVFNLYVQDSSIKVAQAVKLLTAWLCNLNITLEAGRLAHRLQSLILPAGWQSRFTGIRIYMYKPIDTSIEEYKIKTLKHCASYMPETENKTKQTIKPLG